MLWAFTSGGLHRRLPALDLRRFCIQDLFLPFLLSCECIDRNADITQIYPNKIELAIHNFPSVRYA